MANKYDVIIVGGGLAGCTLGYLLKKQGKKTLIIEKCSLDKKDKLCGGLLTPKSIKLLSNIFNASEVDKLLACKYNGVVLRNQKQNIILSDIGMASVYRKQLDDYVLSQYINAGGEIIDNTVFSQINAAEKSIVINNNTYYYNHLVGADGTLSQLRKYFTKKTQHKVYATEVYCTPNDKFNKVEIFFFNKFKGYGWIIPNNNNVLIGIGAGQIDAKNINSAFDKFLVSTNTGDVKKRGAYLPSGSEILLNIGSNIFFVGDSAGLISPITGEGIYFALLSAKLLSETMDEGYLKAMEPTINRINRELQLKKYVYRKWLRMFLFSMYHKTKYFKRKIDRFAKYRLLD